MRSWNETLNSISYLLKDGLQKWKDGQPNYSEFGWVGEDKSLQTSKTTRAQKKDLLPQLIIIIQSWSWSPSTTKNSQVEDCFTLKSQSEIMIYQYIIFFPLYTEGPNHVFLISPWTLLKFSQLKVLSTNTHAARSFYQRCFCFFADFLSWSKRSTFSLQKISAFILLTGKKYWGKNGSISCRIY